jgi:hypothetical protein
MTERYRKPLSTSAMAVAALALIGLAVVSGLWLGSLRLSTVQVRSLAPSIVQLERIGELAMMRVHVTDILLAEGEGYRGSWLINGDALLSCNVSHTTITDIDSEKRTATIRLPKLRAISVRVNHDRTKTWSVEKTTWLPWKWGDQGLLRDAAMFHAQQLVEAAANSERHMTYAKSQAETLVRQMYNFIGWTVRVEWE